MLDYHSRSHTDDWSQTETRAAAVQANDPAAHAYAWSVEPAAEYPAPARRWSRMSRPMMFVGVGAGTTAAVAAALVLVFSGPTKTADVSTPNASTAITAVQTKTTVPSTHPAGPSAAPRQQVHHSASPSPAAPHHVSTSYSSNDTTSTDTKHVERTREQPQAPSTAMGHARGTTRPPRPRRPRGTSPSFGRTSIRRNTVTATTTARAVITGGSPMTAMSTRRPTGTSNTHKEAQGADK